ncbi:hypothetical protein [Pseudomonas sp. CGJS7]|uniref:hypothetical protein n=1 Tax=Pseudomonas sp. CGJS7 TaxID=3109348 RepID=UPI0030083670
MNMSAHATRPMDLRGLLLLPLLGLAFAADAADTASRQIAPANNNAKTVDASRIYGRIQIVKSFPDYKVKVVRAFPDLRVQVVKSFPNGPGKWQMVDSFPDYKVQLVDSFADFEIQYVDSFPGRP